VAEPGLRAQLDSARLRLAGCWGDGTSPAAFPRRYFPPFPSSPSSQCSATISSLS
jgi:hypothetical protein